MTGHIRAKEVYGRLELYSDGTDGAGNPIETIELINVPGTDNPLGPLADEGLGIAFNTATNQGFYNIPKFQISRHTNVPEYKLNDDYARPSGSVWMKTTTPNLGAKYVIRKWNNATKLWESLDVNLYDSQEAAHHELARRGGRAN